MAATSLLWTPTSLTLNGGREPLKLNANSISFQHRRFRSKTRICCSNDDTKRQTPQPEAIQVYSQIERLLTDSARQSQNAWWGSGDWSEVEGSWILQPKSSKPNFVVHFVGGIFVGAAPQLTYRWFLERLSQKGVLVIATPYASGFDHFLIADEVQFKFDRCYCSLQETGQDMQCKDLEMFSWHSITRKQVQLSPCSLQFLCQWLKALVHFYRIFFLHQLYELGSVLIHNYLTWKWRKTSINI